MHVSWDLEILIVERGIVILRWRSSNTHRRPMRATGIAKATSATSGTATARVGVTNYY